MELKEVKHALEIIINHTNRAKRLHRTGLALLLETDERTIRRAIRELRFAGCHICTDTVDGGYYQGTPEEWDSFCDQQRRRAVHNFYPKSKESPGQISLLECLSK